MAPRRTKVQTVDQPDADPGLHAEAAPQSETAAIGSQERHQRIARRAYYRAESRGFAPGKELDDWLAAEAEVEEELQRRPGRERGVSSN